jgi:uncharacterized RDD family membrane protein YckC
MKCPKCGYLGFDSAERCKNCGYEFSLIGSGPTPVPDANLARGSRFRNTPGRPTPPPGVERRLTPAPEGTPLDLPLFGEGMPAPRKPLGVRRPTPTPSRIRPRTDRQPAVPLALNLEAPATLVPRATAAPPRPSPVASPIASVQPAVAAPPSRRFAAAALDALLLGGLDAVVLTFTLKLCGVAVAQMLSLPLVPLVGFLVLLDGGYCVLFTGTMGQTLGKMALGIRVVTDGRDEIDLSRAAWRTVAMMLSILPAGLGFAPAAFGDFRALHDRVAGTRVIQHAAAS